VLSTMVSGLLTLVVVLQKQVCWGHDFSIRTFFKEFLNMMHTTHSKYYLQNSVFCIFITEYISFGLLNCSYILIPKVMTKRLFLLLRSLVCIPQSRDSLSRNYQHA